jgi:hypothetical protein
MKLTITIGKINYESKAETVLEAIRSIELPFFVKGKIILEVKKGGTGKDKNKGTKRVMNFAQIRRLKNDETYQLILAKNLELFLK